MSTSVSNMLSVYKNYGLQPMSFERVNVVERNGKPDKSYMGLPKEYNELTLNELEKHVSEQHKCISILAGKRSNVTIIDFDQPKASDIASGYIDGMKIFRDLQIDKLPTPMSKTPSGGYHVYFQYEPSIKTENKISINNGKRSTIDILSDKKMCTEFPTCINDDPSRQYTWIKSFEDYKPMKLPDYLMKWLPSAKQVQKTTKIPSQDTPLTISIEELKTLLNQVSTERKDPYDSWFEVGTIIYNCTNGSQEGLELWDEWSQESPKYTNECCENKWNSMHLNSSKTIASLHYMIKQDNPEQHKVNLAMKLEKELKNIPRMLPPNSAPTGDHEFDSYDFHDLNKYIAGKDIVDQKDVEALARACKRSLVKVILGAGDWFYCTWNKTTETWTFGLKNRKPFDDKLVIVIGERIITDKNGNVVSRRDDKVSLNDWISEHERGIIDMRYCSQVSFDPQETTNNDVFNQFTGFVSHPAEEEVTEDDVHPFLFHIHEVFANGNKEYYDYIVKWFATIIQKRTKNPVALVLYSEVQRTGGKSLFTEGFGKKVLGKAYTETSASVDEFISRQFNTDQVSLMLTIFDEASFSGNKRLADRLKGRITQSVLRSEIKGGAVLKTDDHNSFIFLSNREVPVHLEKHDARFAVFECSCKYPRGDPYFKPLMDAFESKEMCNKFHKYLLQVDLSDFDILQIPETTMRKELRQLDNNPIDDWFEDEKESHWIKQKQKRPSQEVFADFIQWCQREGIDTKYKTCVAFVKHLKSLGFCGGRERAVDKYTSKISQRRVIWHQG